MSSVLTPSAPPLPVAQCLDAAVGLFRAALLTCLPYGVLTLLSSQLPNMYSYLGVASPLSPGWWLANIAGGLLTATFLNATLLRLAAVAAHRGKGPFLPDVRQELATAVARVPAFIGLLLLIAVATVVLWAPSLLVPRAARGLAIGVGALGLLYLGVMLSCAWVDMVLNGRGVLQSVTESIGLVRGSAWRVAAIGTVAVLMIMVLATVAGIVIYTVVDFVVGHDMALSTAITADVMVACTAAAVPFLAALLFTLFRQLRALKAAGSAGPAPE